MARALSSCKMQCRHRASTMTVAAYQRHGWSQSGNRLIVWPQERHRKRRTQMTIQPVSNRPRTCREYNPWPTNLRVLLVSRANSPQKMQNFGRRISIDGASGLSAHSCSTEMARLCRMTNVWFGGGVESRVSPKEGPRHRLPSLQTVGHPTQAFRKSTRAKSPESRRRGLSVWHNQAGRCRNKQDSSPGRG